MARWWTSWYEPVADDGDYRPTMWPLPAEIAGYWCSGVSGDGEHAILCAVIDAPDEEEVFRLVGRCWPKTAKREERFCEPMEAGEMPASDRFPVMPWMSEPRRPAKKAGTSARGRR